MSVTFYKNIVIISISWLILIYSSCPLMGSVINEENKVAIFNKAYSLQIPFIENKGQIKDKNIKYYAKTLGGTTFITEDGQIVYSFPKYAKEKGAREWMIKESFLGASTYRIKGEDESITKINYFKGKYPSHWRSDISTYNLVNYGEIYKGIELKLKAYGNNVEKLFYVKPGVNPKSIKIKMEGSNDLRINNNKKGELEIVTGLEFIKFTKPVAYQDIDGKRKYIKVAYKVDGNEYSFDIGNYNKTKPLVIDPLLASTYLGGTENDHPWSIVLDANENVYIAGYTRSADFPTTPGAYYPIFNGARDAFISKFDSNLENLLASTFLGGSDSEGLAENDEGSFAEISMAIDTNGNVYVAGYTRSSDFPVTYGVYDPNFNGTRDVFVSKFDSNLENLLASTFLGGSNLDRGEAIFISDNSVYLAGSTRSDNFPTTISAYDTTYNGGGDGFIAKLDNSLENLLASTFLGGSSDDDDEVRDLLIDNGIVYVAGETASSDFPTTPNAYDPIYNGGEEDGFVAKLDSNLERLLTSTFLGGSVDEDDGDRIHSMFIGNNNIYVIGMTDSIDFPVTPGSYDTIHNLGLDSFISKFDSDLENLQASTFLGGGDADIGMFGCLGMNGNVYITGFTFSSDFPVTSNAHDTIYNGSMDGFVSRLDSNLQILQASTFLDASGLSMAIEDEGNIYLACFANSDNLQATGYDKTYDGGGDVFIAKIDSNLLGTGITVNPISGLITTESEDTDTFTVVLKTKPTADVTINISSSDQSEGLIISPLGSLIFAPDDWNVPQTVTITGVDDDDDDGNVEYTIILSSAISEDGNYNNLDPEDVSVTNFDNDLTPNAGVDLRIYEGMTVLLDGSFSENLDGNIASYRWEQTSGDPIVTLSDPNISKPNFVAPPIDPNEIELGFTLTIEDGNGFDASDVVLITIIDNGIGNVPSDWYSTISSTGQPIGIKPDNAGDLTSLYTVNPATIAVTNNRPENLIYGLIDMQFKVTPGATVTVTIDLLNPILEGYKWYKYSSQAGWYDYSAYAVFNDTQVTLTLTDGGIGDDDGIVNGVITDPSGLGTAPSGSSGSNGGNGGGGCFITNLLEKIRKLI